MFINGMYISYSNRIKEHVKKSIKTFFCEIFGDCHIVFFTIENQRCLRVTSLKNKILDENTLYKIGSFFENVNVQSPRIIII